VKILILEEAINMIIASSKSRIISQGSTISDFFANMKKALNSESILNILNSDIRRAVVNNFLTNVVFNEIKYYIKYLEKFETKVMYDQKYKEKPFKNKNRKEDEEDVKFCNDDDNTICIADKINPLSNNHNMRLEDMDKKATRTYKSVSNYIYSSFNDICILDKYAIEEIEPENALHKSLI
jgi:hypothetical protein